MPLLDPVQGVVCGTEFPSIARGSPAPSKLGQEGNVDTGPHIARVSAPTEKVIVPPAGGSSGEGRAFSDKKSRRIIDTGVCQSQSFKTMDLRNALVGFVMLCKMTFGTTKNLLLESQYNRLESASKLATILKWPSPKLVDDC